MPRHRIAWALTLVLALAALGSSVAWSVTRFDHHPAVGPYGRGMMGYSARGGGAPVRDLAQARARAGEFAGRLALRVGEVMQFSNSFYAELTEGGGSGATEILIDPASGATWFEYGPAMMWNTRYGMMRGTGSAARTGPAMSGWMTGGMMGGGGAPSPAVTPAGGAAAQVDAQEARRIAQRWLDANGGARRASAPEAFPGYFTMDVTRGGAIDGMLSVNASTGAVWYHGWHGRFVAKDG